mgnify:CR=1 FL=1
MENLLNRIGNLKLLLKKQITLVLSSFSRKEWILFIVLFSILVTSSLLILENINQSFMVGVPERGGSISEGIVGSPHYINPVLAFSDADRDLTSLIYSGLMRKNGDGTLTPDLAEKYDISKDGLVYTFTLKNNLYFHNDEMLTADDVVYTIQTIKDPISKSPRKVNFDGVSIEKIDNKTIKFTLKQPHAFFLENMTIGILPKNVWDKSFIELNDANINAVGSGPYMISNVNKTDNNITSYELTSFKKFILGAPYIKNIILNFYSNENEMITALEDGQVDQISSIAPENAKDLESKDYNVKYSVLPRVFGLFFNQNQNQIFTNKTVVKAINDAINKDRIIKEVLQGYGVVIADPIPPNMASYQEISSTTKDSREKSLEKVKASLAKDGWNMGPSGYLEKTVTEKKKKTTTVLEFSISTSNTPDLAKSAEYIKEDLTAIGMKVDIKTFENGSLTQSVIRPRKYDALLYGQVINNEGDLFAFWHSSQRNDPGLNVAMYTNAKVDKILEDAFVTIDEQSRIKKYSQFEDEIKKDMPAVFLYSPNFIYVVNKDLKGLNIDQINSPTDRFANIYSWYTETDNVWKIFAN